MQPNLQKAASGVFRCPKLAAIVEAGPDPAADGVVRWRRVDLQRVIKERFGVDYNERYVSTLLHKLGFSHMSARPRHLGPNRETIGTFKKLLTPVESSSRRCSKVNAGRDMVSKPALGPD